MIPVGLSHFTKKNLEMRDNNKPFVKTKAYQADEPENAIAGGMRKPNKQVKTKRPSGLGNRG